jgi:type II secretory pathway component PulF
MALFHYRALSADGRTLTGTLAAEDRTGVAHRLREAGAWLLEAQEASAGTATAAAAATVGVHRRLRVPRSDLINFSLQVSLLLNSGVTLPQALRRLADDYAGTRLGMVLQELHDQVAVGEPLHTAMQRFPRVFPLHVSALVEAGETSGQLPTIFASLADHYEWVDKLSADLRQATVYPLTVCGASLALVVLLFTFVVPRFSSLLVELNLAVPNLTRAVAAVSEVMVNHWSIWVGALAALAAGLRWGRTVPAVAAAWDAWMLRLPVLGPLFAMVALSRFAQNLALLYRSGIPLLRGLEVVRGLVGNRALAAAVGRLHAALEQGIPLHRGLAAEPLFPATVVTMVSTGESAGSLDVALQSVADYYNKLLPRRLKLAFAWFDPLAMFALVGLVALVAVAVILPILQLWQAR